MTQKNTGKVHYMGMVDHVRKCCKVFNKLARFENMIRSSTRGEGFNMWARLTHVGKDEKHKTGGDG